MVLFIPFHRNLTPSSPLTHISSIQKKSYFPLKPKFPTVCTWVPCGVCMGSVQSVQRFLAVFAWVPCGVCIGSVRCVHGFRAACAWVPCGVCMGYYIYITGSKKSRYSLVRHCTARLVSFKFHQLLPGAESPILVTCEYRSCGN